MVAPKAENKRNFERFESLLSPLSFVSTSYAKPLHDRVVSAPMHYDSHTHRLSGRSVTEDRTVSVAAALSRCLDGSLDPGEPATRLRARYQVPGASTAHRSRTPGGGVPKKRLDTHDPSASARPAGRKNGTERCGEATVRASPLRMWHNRAPFAGTDALSH